MTTLLVVRRLEMTRARRLLGPRHTLQSLVQSPLRLALKSLVRGTRRKEFKSLAWSRNRIHALSKLRTQVWSRTGSILEEGRPGRLRRRAV
jgi:hypothetical protein